MPEWLKGMDCKSIGLRLRWFESSPAHHQAGVAQLVERQLPKLNVESSSLFSRSTKKDPSKTGLS